MIIIPANLGGSINSLRTGCTFIGPTRDRVYTLPDQDAKIAFLDIAGIYTGVISIQLSTNGVVSYIQGLEIISSTPATAGVTRQYSPTLLFIANAWNTTTTLNQKVGWRIFVDPSAGAVPGSQMRFQYSQDGTTFSDSGISFAPGSLTSIYFQTSTALITTIDGGNVAIFTANMVGSTGGPTVAAQHGWLKVKDSTGAITWVPVWK